jgi:hypothetical protein
MRLDDALKQGRRVYACVRGWESSDGKAGSPRAAGQILAWIVRTRWRASVPTISYFEGHGTGPPWERNRLPYWPGLGRRGPAPPRPPGSIEASITHQGGGGVPG